MGAVGVFLRGGLVPPSVGGQDVVTGAVVALVGQRDQPGGGERICYHGVSDIFRIPKPAAGVYKSQCDPKEEIVLEPAFDWSRGDRNESFNVAVVCSNCERVKIYMGER